MRHVRSAAFSRRRYLKTEHVETMAIFLFSVPLLFRTRVRVYDPFISFFPSLSFSFTVVSDRISRNPWVYVTQARTRKARARISLYYLRLYEKIYAKLTQKQAITPNKARFSRRYFFSFCLLSNRKAVSYSLRTYFINVPFVFSFSLLFTLDLVIL